MEMEVEVAGFVMLAMLGSTKLREKEAAESCHARDCGTGVGST